MKTIYIVDDHEVVVKGLISCVDSLPKFKVIGTASDLNSAKQRVLALKPDVLILDYNFPEGTGSSIIRPLLDGHEGLKIVVYSFVSQLSVIQKVFAQGVVGYLLKGDGLDELSDCLQAVCKGEKYVSNSIGAIDFKEELALTEREHEVAMLIINGDSSKSIADTLSLSFHTVETHRRSIRKKLGVKSVAELIAVYGKNK